MYKLFAGLANPTILWLLDIAGTVYKIVKNPARLLRETGKVLVPDRPM